MQINTQNPYSNFHVAGQLYDFQQKEVLPQQPQQLDPQAIQNEPAPPAVIRDVLAKFLEKQRGLQKQEAPSENSIENLKEAFNEKLANFAINEEVDEEEEVEEIEEGGPAAIPVRAEDLEEVASELSGEEVSSEVSGEASCDEEPAMSVDQATLTALWEELEKQPNSKKLLGQMLFLMDFDSDATLEIANKDNPELHITNSFKEILNREKDALELKVTELHKYKIVAESNTLRRSMLPGIVANMLITSTGFFNTEIIDDVKEVFFHKADLSNQKVIADVLDIFAKQGECYRLLDETQEPDLDNKFASKLLTAMRSLDDETDLTSSQIKSCVLAACLTEITQSSVDTQVNYTFGKLLKEANLARFITDVQALVKTGYLERSVDGLPTVVPFAIDGNSSPVNKIFSTSANGSITNNWFEQNERLWHVHGIIEACNALGIEDVEAACKNALKQLGGANPPKRFDVSAKDVILKFAEEEIRAEKEKDPTFAVNVADLANIGYIAFTAVYENPLVRAWQNALTSMASLRTRAQHVAQVQQAVRDVLVGQFTVGDIHERAALARVFAKFLTELKTNLVEYSPKSPRAFSEFILKTLTTNDTQTEEVSRKLMPILKYIDSDVFTAAVCQKFDAVNKPWDSRQITIHSLVRTYDEAFPADFVPVNAHVLFAELGKHAATLKPQTSGYLVSPQHALLFTPTEVFTQMHARSFWEKYIDQSKAILHKFILTQEGRQQIYSFIQKNILSEEFGESFAEDVTSIKQKLTFKDFRAEVHARLEHYLQGVGLEKAQEVLDDYFTEILKTRGAPVLTFASSMNDIDGAKAEFCFYADPVVEDAAIGMIQNNKLIRLNQSEWFNNTAWVFGQMDAEPVNV